MGAWSSKDHIISCKMASVMQKRKKAVSQQKPCFSVLQYTWRKGKERLERKMGEEVPFPIMSIERLPYLSH